jgi:uncharacterized protein YecA (UPF0149 family)
MNKADTRLLTKFLESPERPEGTLRFHELQGLLFAIASSPETVLPSEWLPLIGNDAGLFRTEPRKIHARIRKRKRALTLSCKRDPELLRHFRRSGPWIARNK